jgi:hypothetical protein
MVGVSSNVVDGDFAGTREQISRAFGSFGSFSLDPGCIERQQILSRSTLFATHHNGSKTARGSTFEIKIRRLSGYLWILCLYSIGINNQRSCRRRFPECSEFGAGGRRHYTRRRRSL